MLRSSDGARRRSFGRFGAVVVAALAFAAVGAASASATTDYYYGFNYLTIGSPTDCKAAWSPNDGHGCAQNGFNYWDWSQMTKNSGDFIALGFRDTGGLFYYFSYNYVYNGTTFHVTRGGLFAPTYNRAFCAYQSGSSSYVRCSAVLL